LDILDTDTLSYFERGQPKIVDRVLAQPLSMTTVSVISVIEQFSGRQANLRTARTTTEIADAYLRMTNLARVLSGFNIITFSESAILRYRFLLSLKLNIGGMDLRIAAIALEEDATMVKRNLRDFGRVPELKCENWTD